MKNIQGIYNFFRYILKQRNLIFSLSINDFKQKYSKSYLGLFWSFIQPIITIGVMWFVFTVGFRAGEAEPGIPYVLWLTAGLIPWYYFSETFFSSANVLFEYSYMLRQMIFKAEVLPLIKIISNVFTHFFFIIIVIIISLVNKFMINIYFFQIIYYMFCLCFLLTGLSWFFSSLKAFLPDIGEIITVVVQLGFWVTPILWSAKMLPKKILWLFKLNPMFYIIQGYRDTFIYKIWFWEKPYWTTEFFLITIFIFFAGIFVFRKLKPHFNDVL